MNRTISPDEALRRSMRAAGPTIASACSFSTSAVPLLRTLFLFGRVHLTHRCHLHRLRTYTHKQDDAERRARPIEALEITRNEAYGRARTDRRHEASEWPELARVADANCRD